MSKGERMEAYIASLGFDGQSHHASYLGYFACFNSQEYYEAHDVLEHLWLQGRDENYAFFKGLIQFAGAFVHLKKQRERPFHPKDGRRMHPAVRLFALAAANLRPYGRVYMDLDLDEVHRIIADYVSRIELSNFAENPWRPESAPVLRLISSESATA